MLLKILTFFIIFLTACSQKPTVSDILGKDRREFTVKVILIKNNKFDTSLQRVSLEIFEDKLRNPPIDVKAKLTLFKKEVKLILKDKNVENYYDPVEIAKENKDSDLVVTMEVKDISYTEKKYKTKEEDIGLTYFCIERSANSNILFNVIITKTEEVIFARTYNGFFYKRYCDEKEYVPEKLPNSDYMKLKSLEKAQLKFIRNFYDLL
ncbi:MAG TPA: hypothetical protein EYG91_07455 [Aquifex aeolicus]|nr:hypothetical protein [Aquifex aeolicus]